jgi:hypothetical protein
MILVLLGLKYSTRVHHTDPVSYAAARFYQIDDLTEMIEMVETTRTLSTTLINIFANECIANLG